MSNTATSCRTVKMPNLPPNYSHTSTFVPMPWGDTIASILVEYDSGSQINNFWTDGINIYYSHKHTNLVFDKKTLQWENKSWSVTDYFDGYNIWSDGTRLYYSTYDYGNYAFNGDDWEPFVWDYPGKDNDDRPFWGNDVWTDGKNIFYSYSSDQQYVLIDGIWENKTWYGPVIPDAYHLWTDGTNIYYSYMSSQYVLNGDTWEAKEWKFEGSKSAPPGGFLAKNMWSDGTSIYYTDATTSLIYNKETDTWVPYDYAHYGAEWSGPFSTASYYSGDCYFYGKNIWTDGNNIYYSQGYSAYIGGEQRSRVQHILLPKSAGFVAISGSDRNEDSPWSTLDKFKIPSGIGEIKENGTHDVASIARVKVDVDMPGQFIVDTVDNLPTDAVIGSLAIVIRR